MTKPLFDNLEIRQFRAFDYIKIDQLGHINLFLGKNNVVLFVTTCVFCIIEDLIISVVALIDFALRCDLRSGCVPPTSITPTATARPSLPAKLNCTSHSYSPLRDYRAPFGLLDPSGSNLGAWTCKSRISAAEGP